LYVDLKGSQLTQVQFGNCYSVPV